MGDTMNDNENLAEYYNLTRDLSEFDESAAEPMWVRQEVKFVDSAEVEAVEATPSDAVNVARNSLKHALRELDKIPPSHDADHVRTWIDSALAWLRSAS
jgi:hypothetical protein